MERGLRGASVALRMVLSEATTIFLQAAPGFAFLPGGGHLGPPPCHLPDPQASPSLPDILILERARRPSGQDVGAAWPTRARPPCLTPCYGCKHTDWDMGEHAVLDCEHATINHVCQRLTHREVTNDQRGYLRSMRADSRGNHLHGCTGKVFEPKSYHMSCIEVPHDW